LLIALLQFDFFAFLKPMPPPYKINHQDLFIKNLKIFKIPLKTEKTNFYLI